MSNYMKQPLLENMRSNLYSFYTDKTSDVTPIEQLAIYATLLRNQSISEHFIGLTPISEEVGGHLSAVILCPHLKFLCQKQHKSSTSSFCLYGYHKRQFW